MHRNKVHSLETLPSRSKIVLFENGSYCSKVGVSTNQSPSSLIKNIVSRYRAGCMLGMKIPDDIVGDFGNNWYKSNPNPIISKGVVMNWDDMEKVWHHAFYNRLRVDISNQYIVMTEAILNPKANRERATQILFETFYFEGIFLGISQVFALKALNETTGIILDSGHTQTSIIPIIENQVILYAINRVDIGGEGVTNKLRNILTTPDGRLLKVSEVNEVKEILAQINVNKLSQDLDKMFMYMIKDKAVRVTLREIFDCTDVIFHINSLGDSIQSSLLTSLRKLESNVSWDIYITGGNSATPGFKKRLENEIRSLKPDFHHRIVQPKNYKILTWLGMKVFVSCGDFEKRKLTIDDYDEEGPVLINRFCEHKVVTE